MKVRALAKVRPTYFAKGLVSLNDNINISLYSDIVQLQLNQLRLSRGFGAQDGLMM